MKNQSFRILIVDDHAIFREGLRELISHWDDFKVLGECENGQETLDFCQKTVPDIILMDIHMPVMSGVEATRAIQAGYPSVHVVMLTMSVDEEDLFEAIKAGAQGYILKDVHARQLHNSLRGVMQGESPLSSVMAAKVLAEFNKTEKPAGEMKPSAPKTEELTEREIQILQYVVAGLTNSEIGEQLFLSEQTIKKDLSNIMLKLHLNNRVQVATYALREGLAK
jgi:DNA-binding NarL/FixJ family response regulator